MCVNVSERECVCVSVCVYVCVRDTHVHTHTHACTHAYTHTLTHACMHCCKHGLLNIAFICFECVESDLDGKSCMLLLPLLMLVL